MRLKEFFNKENMGRGQKTKPIVSNSTLNPTDRILTPQIIYVQTG